MLLLTDKYDDDELRSDQEQHGRILLAASPHHASRPPASNLSPLTRPFDWVPNDSETERLIEKRESEPPKNGRNSTAEFRTSDCWRRIRLQEAERIPDLRLRSVDGRWSAHGGLQGTNIGRLTLTSSKELACQGTLSDSNTACWKHAGGNGGKPLT
jgi:hypothetical protein